MKRAVFLDLNGTVVMPLKQEYLSELSLIDGVAPAIARLNRAHYVCPVVTVQSRIAKGLFSEQDFRRWFDGLAKELTGFGATVVGPYVCPHRYAEPCACKKPSTLLFEVAAAEHGVNLERSFVIGDTADDVEAAKRFGGQGCLVKTGWAAQPSEVERAAPYAAFMANTFTEAVDWILRLDG